MNILVTGATGFVGSEIVDKLLLSLKFTPRVAIRRTNHPFLAAVDVAQVGDLSFDTDWEAALSGIDAVVHAAARVHVMHDAVNDPLDEFRRVNVAGTLSLARQAASSGVKRFVFISSIKVNGEGTSPGEPFTSKDTSEPEDPYGVSKMEAEQGLHQIASETGMEVVIIRPPLVYGPGVKGNFASLMRLVEKGIPLPLGAIHNKRSLVALDNLVDLIVTCIDHPAAANQTFLAGDGEDLSTTELLQRMAKAMEKSACLIPVPASVLMLGATLLGKKAVAQRLLGSLQVDIAKTKRVLNWEPPVSVEDGLKRCVEHVGQNVIRANKFIYRFVDILLSACGLIVASPVLLILVIAGLFDTGSPLFRQERVGKDQKPFVLVKFRTMKVNTASVASHLANASSITKLGLFLRRTKLDELPQLWNVLKGEMSLVGPRPCLYNQEELIRERSERGVDKVRPGITGLAQVNDIDMSTPELLAQTDARMIAGMSLKNYFTYILQTVTGKGSGDRVK
jgi:lipopolysaccharide/colanic/teichoic acid biosynthesis glycosyltransferase/dTDP-4-dehydrorhamnose reductase